MNKRFLLVIVPVVHVVIILLIGSSPYAWIASKELAAGSHGPSAVQQDVIRAYYEALDTCDVKAFERLSIRGPVSYTHLRAHETRHDIVCRLLLEKKKKKKTK